jgi:hypothetical protein
LAVTAHVAAQIEQRLGVSRLNYRTQQISEYLYGQRTTFELTLTGHSAPFQRQVLEQQLAILWKPHSHGSPAPDRKPLAPEPWVVRSNEPNPSHHPATGSLAQMEV